MPFGFKLDWFGDRIVKMVKDKNDAKMRATGEAIVARAKQLVPVDTGKLRDSIGYTYRQSDSTLTIHVDMYYGLWVEAGTRYMRPQPYIRPALNEVGRIFGTSVEMAFAVPAAGRWNSMLMHQAGFAHPRSLTAKQRAHVRQHLMPTSKRLYRGNVRRAKMVVRRPH